MEQNGEFSKFLEEFVKETENSDQETEQIALEPVEPSKSNILPDSKKDQLIKEEEAFIGAVSYKVYLQYARTAGILMTILIFLFNALYQVFAVLSSLWLTQWSEESEEVQRNSQDYYLGIFGGLGIGQCKLQFNDQNLLFNSYLIFSYIHAVGLLSCDLWNNRSFQESSQFTHTEYFKASHDIF